MARRAGHSGAPSKPSTERANQLHALSVLTDRDALSELLSDVSAAELMDLVERLSTALEDLPVDGEALEQAPAGLTLPVVPDLLPALT
ncbi:MAG TPA: hypothetical protein VME46_26245 [Acidimicrobiales bacterium]|nr:hypothetical protein [Acidimicrobiales bacterium]